MEQTDHVLIAGGGSDRLAAALGIPQVEPDYYITAERAQQQRLAAQLGKVTLDHDSVYNGPAPTDKSGTVGAVARDDRGHLAAATSTGGMTNKRVGRCGDTPIIGAGTWADDATCAVSATGHGEYFIRVALAHDVHARMAYGGAALQDAANAALVRIAAMGGTGGLIAIDTEGRLALPYTSEGMYRAWVGADGQVRVAIYADD
jgi:isoaspartyl peptidase/L-asparaginase-like protein (Ntn-hydrolase superfamily)